MCRCAPCRYFFQLSVGLPIIDSTLSPSIQLLATLRLNYSVFSYSPPMPKDDSNDRPMKMEWMIFRIPRRESARFNHLCLSSWSAVHLQHKNPVSNSKTIEQYHGHKQRSGYAADVQGVYRSSGSVLSILDKKSLKVFPHLDGSSSWGIWPVPALNMARRALRRFGGR